MDDTLQNLKYKKHIFVCNNQKEDGKKSCGAAHGKEVVEAMRAHLKEKGVSPLEVRVNTSGCMNLCKEGPTMAVFPEGVYYGAINTIEEALKIADEHIIGNQIVKEKQLLFPS